jgi:Negative regulator of genetic competence, sporulation and motility
MRIEKINANQIKCTLTRDDLIDRELKLSELAYGTEKAKSLFKDMMQQAFYEVGFEADDIPLMIEAIPLSPECIILIITKVDDPEELDTRFAKFSPSFSDDDLDSYSSYSPKTEGADDIVGLYKRIQDAKATFASKGEALAELEKEIPDIKTIKDLTRLYSFKNLDSAIEAARNFKEYYTGYNSLYKDPKTGNYSLIIKKSLHTPEEFNKICNILSEYATNAKHTNATEAHLKEHAVLLIHQNALQQLAQI